jgi:hypothetical protein
MMIGACVALTACGGGADGFETMPTTAWLETTTTSAPVESPLVTSSTSITSTSPPATTATTVAMSVETTTTLSIEQDVRAGLDEIEANIMLCLTAPLECDPTTIAVINSPVHQYFTELATTYAADGLVVRDVGARRQIVESVRVGLDGRSAMVHVCGVDGDWLLDPGASVDPADDIIVNDDIVSRRTEWLILKTPAGWRRHSGQTLETWLGEDRCPVS